MAAITIRQYESGAREPKFDSLQNIASALGILPVDLMNFDEACELIENDVNRKLAWRVNLFSGAPSDEELSRFEKIVDCFEVLNDRGQQIAVERVEELAKVPDYQRNDEPKEEQK